MIPESNGEFEAFDLSKTVDRLKGLDWLEMCKAVMFEIAVVKSDNIYKGSSGVKILTARRKYVNALRWFYSTLRDDNSKQKVHKDIREKFQPLFKELEKKGQFVISD